MHQVWQGNFLGKDYQWILFPFVVYGFFAGVFSYASTWSYDAGQMDAIATIVNLPTFYVIFTANPDGFSIDPSIFPAAIIANSMAVWSAIGLLVYALIRLFRLGS